MTTVRSVKFIPGGGDEDRDRDTEQRIVIMDESGMISVISWNTNGGEMKITATLSQSDKKCIPMTSMAVHLEEPLLLWADEEGRVNLQSWQGELYIRKFLGDWLDELCIRTIQGSSLWENYQVKFHPKDENSFVGVCGRHIQVCLSFFFVVYSRCTNGYFLLPKNKTISSIVLN